MKAHDEDCDVIIFGNDDVICETERWDIHLRENYDLLPKHQIGCFLLKSNWVFFPSLIFLEYVSGKY